MLTRYACWLNGEGLQDIDPTVYIKDIEEKAPEEEISLVSNAVYAGTRVASRVRTALEVAISFAVREYDVMRRRGIVEKIRAWAQDGVLTTNEHQDQQLRVVCTELPVVSSALKWTDELKVVFTAYEQPYWEEAYPVTATITGSSGQSDLRPMGTQRCRMEAVIRAIDDIARVKLTAGDAFWAFEDLAMSKGKSLVLSYDSHGVLTATVDGVGMLAKRTPASADDLWLMANRENRVLLEADGQVTATLKARGLWR